MEWSSLGVRRLFRQLEGMSLNTSDVRQSKAPFSAHSSKIHLTDEPFCLNQPGMLVNCFQTSCCSIFVYTNVMLSGQDYWKLRGSDHCILNCYTFSSEIVSWGYVVLTRWQIHLPEILGVIFTPNPPAVASLHSMMQNLGRNYPRNKLPCAKTIRLSNGVIDLDTTVAQNGGCLVPYHDHSLSGHWDAL